MTDNTQPEALRALAESVAWTGRWYDAGCNTVHCTYDKEDSIEHDEIAHPVPLGVSGYIAAAHPQAVIALLDRIAELEAQLEAIGAGGVSGPLIGQAQAMPDLSALTERGATAWAGVDAQGLREGRWYMVTHDGVATLCEDRRDAEKEAKDADMAWPHSGPHRAVQLVEASTAGFTAADMATASAQGFRDGAAYVAASAREPVYQARYQKGFWQDSSRISGQAEEDELLEFFARLAPPHPVHIAAPTPPAQAAYSVCYDYAKQIAESMWATHYKADAPHWESCDSLMGVLSQISNMMCGLSSAPADSVLEDAARLTTEQEYAIRQGHEIAASEAYFGARSKLDTNRNHNIFTAGFERGWDAARKQGGE